MSRVFYGINKGINILEKNFEYSDCRTKWPEHRNRSEEASIPRKIFF
jgi:hypothetical protein